MPGPFEYFEAGWNAAQQLHDHEWGPEPPTTASAAFAQYLKICKKGHIIKIVGCTGLLPDGRECWSVNR